MSSCSSDCSSCSSGCPSSGVSHELPNQLSRIKKVIAITSGKGGVGKSLTCAMLAVLMNRLGYKVAVLDADITGPSQARIFGIGEKAESTELGMLPRITKTGIKVMSVNMLLPNETDPVIWRGPVIGGMVQKFWTDVIWHEVDYMFIDMPPGTGDVPLTVFQSIPVDGAVVVTSPQQLVSMIVGKAVKMIEISNIPIIAAVENMSYLECSDCKKHIELFGESRLSDIQKNYNIDVVAKIPINPKFAAACDAGAIELFESDCLDEVAKILAKMTD